MATMAIKTHSRESPPLCESKEAVCGELTQENISKDVGYMVR